MAAPQHPPQKWQAKLITDASITLLELKHQFQEAPNDAVLSTVLNALRGDGYVTGTRMLNGTAKLNPLEQITLTGEGTRDLEDEMLKRSKAQQSLTKNKTSRFILRHF